jgi:hypothetical protein
VNDEARKRKIEEQQRTIDGLLDDNLQLRRSANGLRRCVSLLLAVLLGLIVFLLASNKANAQARENPEKQIPTPEPIVKQKKLSKVCFGRSGKNCIDVNDGQGSIRIYVTFVTIQYLETVEKFDIKKVDQTLLTSSYELEKCPEIRAWLFLADDNAAIYTEQGNDVQKTIWYHFPVVVKK